MNQVFLTVDLGFGDAGKGSIVDYLARKHNAHTVVRYNGGAQAGHRVVEQRADGTQRDHVFAQFGSGTLAGAATHLARFMLVDPLAMTTEAEHLQAIGVADPFARVTIDRDALIVTPFQRAINRLRELARGEQRHGSCGMGIGETMADALEHGGKVLRVGDLCNGATVRQKLSFLHEVNLAKLAKFQDQLPKTTGVATELDLLNCVDWQAWLLPIYIEFADYVQIVPTHFLHEILKQAGTVIFEGAQGVLLDEWHGFHPHTTWSTTTLANADQLLKEAAYTGRVARIGITRAYATRHGAGPFVTEDPVWTAALPDACNGDGTWQQGFRVGPLDLVMLRYALHCVGKLDQLAVTCLDRLPADRPIEICRTYRTCTAIEPAPLARDLAYQTALTHKLMQETPILEYVTNREELPTLLENELHLPVGICSYGPTAEEKVERSDDGEATAWQQTLARGFMGLTK